MQIHITGRHFDVTTALDTYVKEKLLKISRHFDHITSIQVICGLEKSQQLAEATVHLPGDKLFASTEADNMYKAIDLLIDKLDRQIIKFKEKLKNHRVTELDLADEE